MLVRLHIMMMKVWLIALFIALATTTALGAMSLSGCPDRCGDQEVPYPFGTRPGCFFRPSPTDNTFFIKCGEAADNSGKPTPYLGEGSNLDVANITLDGELEISNYLATDCYDKSGKRTDNIVPSVLLNPFTISDVRNKFMAVGCDTSAKIEGYRGENRYTTGCMSSCQKGDNYGDESCSGVGCCQISIPKGLTNMTISVESFYNHTYVWDFNPCSYAFVVEQGMFKMSNTSFQELNKTGYYPRFIINWSIGNVSCESAEKLESYVCEENSKCIESENRPGYLCQCLAGYEGNPYHPDGCQGM